jgi:cell division protein FtsB
MKLLQSKKQTIVTAVLVMAALLVLNASFYGLVHNLLTIKKLNKETAEADMEYARLAAQYEKIQKGGTAYIEDAARVKYNMSAKGEIEFRLPKK